METYERFGFVKVAAITPDLVVADCDYNKDKIKQGIDEALAQKVRIAVFPEHVEICFGRVHFLTLQRMHLLI